ncbi:MAG: CBS domain-containing protein [Magnetococcales bacterium]|nr:CBS domain-containing protein [Magnetococcales bacterium]
MKSTSSPPSRISQSAVYMIRSHAPFNRMDEEHLQFIANHLKLAYFTRGEVILAPGQGVVDKFYIIRQGMVASNEEQSTSQQLSTVVQLMEGECFPLGALLSQRAVTTHFRAVGDVFLLEMDVIHFNTLLELSQPFRDFCNRPFGTLLEISLKNAQADFYLGGYGQVTMETPLHQVIGRPPATCSPATPVGEAMQTMQKLGVGCMVAVDASHGVVGVFTLRDAMERITLPGRDLSTPMSEVMTANPFTLPHDAKVRDAALALARLGLRRVVVTDENKALLGVVAEREIFPLQRVSLSQLHDSIRQASQPAQLKEAGEEITRLIKNLLSQGIGVELVGEVVTNLRQSLVCRIIQLEHEQAQQRGDFSPEIQFCWLTMGSDGRRELSLGGDQDNGLIFQVAEGMDPRSVRDQLANMTLRINNQLDYCGIPLCEGKIMAGNPKWRLPLADWQNLFQGWIDSGTPQALLNAATLFDFRPIYGNFSLAEQLRQWLSKAVVNKRFLNQMTGNALRNQPPLGLFRDFKLNEEGGVDIKLHGTMPFIDAARIFALSCGVEETHTLDRLQLSDEKVKLGSQDVEAWRDAFGFLQLLRLRCNLDRLDKGQPLSHVILPRQLNELDHRILKEVFRQARKLQSRLAMEFQR